MASVQGDPVPLLVSLKAVDPAVYPYYGNIVLSPAGSVRDALTDSTVLVDDNLLVRLNAKVGDMLKIGTQHFRIAAVILREPDRMTAGVGLGPRVMITRHALLQTGLLGLGSRASERYLFKIEIGGNLRTSPHSAPISKRFCPTRRSWTSARPAPSSRAASTAPPDSSALSASSPWCSGPSASPWPCAPTCSSASKFSPS